MADEYDDYEDIDPSAQQEAPSGLRRKLAEATKRAADRDSLFEENQGLKQRLALTDAGLTLNETQRAALLAVTPELSTETLRKNAEALGFVAPPPPPVDPPGLKQQDQFTAAASGSEPPPLDRDAEIDRQLASAQTEAEFMEIYRASGRQIAGSN